MQKHSWISLLFTIGCGSTVELGETSEAATNASIARLQSVPNALANFSRAEKDAHDAQLRLHHQRNLGEGVGTAKAAYASAENSANDALVRAWSNYPVLRTYSYHIEEPLMLAIVDLQSELRRRLGPNNHTVVEGLVDDPGCVGDVVQARLVVRFAEAALTIPTHDLGTAAHPTVEILNLMAHQTACLGARQLAELETALTRGFSSVASRLRQRGFDAILPAFARLVAPIQLLILDVRKGRGSMSESQQWFDAHQSQLLEAVERAGWASGQVLVWDRRLGVLVAHEANLRTLLLSLSDPRAIGTGRCGFSAMLSSGPKSLAASNVGAAGDRYVCPTSSCDSQSLGPIDDKQRQELEKIWGALSDADVGEMQSICRGAGYDALGTMKDLTNCLDQEFASLFSDQNNPFDTFNECIVDGMSLSEVPGTADTGWATGVPEGINCMIGDGGSEIDTSSSAPGAGREPEGVKHVIPGAPSWFTYISSKGRVYQEVSGFYSVVEINGQQTLVLVSRPKNTDQVCQPADNLSREQAARDQCFRG